MNKFNGMINLKHNCIAIQQPGSCSSFLPTSGQWRKGKQPL